MLPSDINSPGGHLQLLGLFLTLILEIFETLVPNLLHHVIILNFSYMLQQILFVLIFCKHLIRLLLIAAEESVVNALLRGTITY